MSNQAWTAGIKQGPSSPLGDAAIAHGESHAGGANRPVHLDDPEVVWFVALGAVDVFSAQVQEDGTLFDFKHTLRASAGRLLFGTGGQGDTAYALVAKGLPGSQLFKVPRSVLSRPEFEDLVAEQVDDWVAGFGSAVARSITLMPRIAAFLEDGQPLDVESDSALSTRHGVLWVADKSEGVALFGTEHPTGGGPGLLPVSTDMWVSALNDTRLVAKRSIELLRAGRLFDALEEFHGLALSAEALNSQLLLVDMANAQVAQDTFRRRSEERASENLFSVLGSGRDMPDGDGSALMRCLHIVGHHEAIKFVAAPLQESRDGPRRTLSAILESSGVRSREVRLKATERWWLGDSGALLAFRKEDDAPVALIPGKLGRYSMVDSESGRFIQLTASNARELDERAHCFHRPLPERPLGYLSVFGFATQRLGVDLVRFGLTGMLAGVLSLLPPVILGFAVDHALASGSLTMLAGLTFSLVSAAFVVALLKTLQGTALMRLEGRGAARLVASVWDRVLGLSQRFLRGFTAGDLSVRVMGFQSLRDQLSGSVANGLMSVIFLLPAFVLLFMYDSALGWVGLWFGLVSLGFTALIGMLQFPQYRRLYAITRRLSGEVLQMMKGIGKLRTTGSEGPAYALWARGYWEQKRAELKIGAYADHLMAFASAAPLVVTATLFGVALGDGQSRVPVGDFLAVNAVFMVFYGAFLQLGMTFAAIAATVPTCEQVMPILKAVPEKAAGTENLSELSGDVRLDHINFRYGEDSPSVLQDVSIRARPGEFVALVGESGSGKSTVFRIVLGLEKPRSGAVYFDGHDLDRLDKGTVRSKIGVVVQDSSLQPGTVLDNICGLAGEYVLEDAWRAARLAAVDTDIMAMPMGMFTPTSERALFSGGQIQRIMLASALARKPRILLLDEATNWLDNKTQERVMQAIEGLTVTRIVSAHRLSTIRKADRIYVLEAGRVIQQGTYDELVNVDGAFRNLVQRQIT